MKKLIILVTLLFSVSAMAEMPKYLEGATVTVTLKNGETHSFKSEEYAIVRRQSMQSPIAKQIIQAVKDERLVTNKKNRVFLLGGYGSTGDLKSSTDGNTYEVKHKKGVVGGVGYQRKVSQKVNIGGQVQTNGTALISVGTDF